MKRLTFLLFLVLCTALGLQAQDLTLPYVQDFSALATGDMLSETGSPTAVAAGTLPGIASVNSAYQAGGAIRLGDGGNVGGFTTQPIDAGAAPFVKVSFNAAAWIAATPAPAKLTLTYGSQSRTVDLQAIGHGWPLSATDMVWYDVTFTAEATPMALIVTTIAESGVENRVFVDNLKIQVVNLVSWSEGFEGSVFPPVGWTAKHISGSKEWTRSTSKQMIIVQLKEGENIEKALKKFKRKYEKTGIVKELRKRQAFVKPSVVKRKKKQHAVYVQQLQENEE